SGYFDVTQKSGWRWSAAKAFLRPIRNRPNLRVLTGAEVERLVIEAGEVRGVIFHHQGQRVEAQARGETILSSGAIGSVQILERSGVGRGELLQAAGIAPQVQVDALGENLQDHL